MSSNWSFLLSGLILSTSSQVSAAPMKKLKVMCDNPRVGYQSNVSGTLTLKPLASGAMIATGTLGIAVGPVRGRTNPVQKIRVKGQYDSVDQFSYVTLGSIEETEVDMIYIDLRDTKTKSNSYLEMSKGARIDINCAGSKVVSSK